jgi:hypothetical protein
MILIVTSQLNASMRLVFKDLIDKHCTKYIIHEVSPENGHSLDTLTTVYPISAVIAFGNKAIAEVKEYLKDLKVPKHGFRHLISSFIGHTSSLDSLLKDNPKRQGFIDLLEELRQPPQTEINTLPPEDTFPPEMLALSIDDLCAVLNSKFTNGEPYVIVLPDDRKLAIVPDGTSLSGYDYIFTAQEVALIIQMHQLFKGRPVSIKDRYGTKLIFENDKN